MERRGPVILFIFATLVLILYIYTFVLISEIDREKMISMMSAGVMYAWLYFELVRRFVIHSIKRTGR